MHVVRDGHVLLALDVVLDLEGARGHVARHHRAPHARSQLHLVGGGLLEVAALHDRRAVALEEADYIRDEQQGAFKESTAAAGRDPYMFFTWKSSAKAPDLPQTDDGKPGRSDAGQSQEFRLQSEKATVPEPCTTATFRAGPQNAVLTNRTEPVLAGPIRT